MGAVVDQQFHYAGQISVAGLVPILEPEVSISSPREQEAETQLRAELEQHVEALPADASIMLKLKIPSRPGEYADLAADPHVLRVLALSGGYGRDEACTVLARNPSMIASFSRALLEGLSDQQTSEQFHSQLVASIEQIRDASVNKTPVG